MRYVNVGLFPWNSRSFIDKHSNKKVQCQCAIGYWRIPGQVISSCSWCICCLCRRGRGEGLGMGIFWECCHLLGEFRRTHWVVIKWGTDHTRCSSQPGVALSQRIVNLNGMPCIDAGQVAWREGRAGRTADASFKERVPSQLSHYLRTTEEATGSGLRG